jgi:hypothetical protein
MIFPWIWKGLPGNTLLKALQLILITLSFALFLFEFVFPWVDTLLVAPPLVSGD